MSSAAHTEPREARRGGGIAATDPRRGIAAAVASPLGRRAIGRRLPGRQEAGAMPSPQEADALVRRSSHVTIVVCDPRRSALARCTAS